MCVHLSLFQGLLLVRMILASTLWGSPRTGATTAPSVSCSGGGQWAMWEIMLRANTSPTRSPIPALTAGMCSAQGRLLRDTNREYTPMSPTNNTLCTDRAWCDLMPRLLWWLLFVFLGEITCREDLYQYLVDNMDGTFVCGLCSCTKPQTTRGNILQHIESKHFPDMFSYPCPECSVVLGTKKALYRHKQNHHPQSIRSYSS